MIKLIKILLISLIILILYKLYPIWEVVEHKLINPLLPFFISFVISYYLYPLKCFFKKKFNNFFSVFLILLIIISIIILFIFIIIPLLYKESTYIINTAFYIIKNISNKYNIDLSFFYKNLLSHLNIRNSYNIFINFFITLFLTIYMLYDMEKIRKIINNLLKNNKYYIIIKRSDKKIKSYLKSTLIISFITFFEYLFFYFIINHYNYFNLAFIASILNIIPYFGGMIFCLIAIMSANNKMLLTKTIIVIIICTIIDTYIINPLTFKKSNGISPILSIISIIIFGSLFNLIGIILSYPLLIILNEIYIYYKK